jgi:predicted DNA-binding protein (MmcQ/YjbR family)
MIGGVSVSDRRHATPREARRSSPTREDVISCCAAQAEAVEDHPFGDGVVVFKVAGKMFALVSFDGHGWVSLKCDPGLAVALRDRHEAVRPGYHMNKRHWNTVDLDGTVPAAEVAEMIDHSYDLVVAGLPRRDRDRLARSAPAMPESSPGVEDGQAADEYRFDAELWHYEGDGGWHFVTVPVEFADDIAARAEGLRRGFGSVRVHARISASTWTTSVFPDSRRGALVLPVRKAIRAAERIDRGDTIAVSLGLVEP